MLRHGVKNTLKFQSTLVELIGQQMHHQNLWICQCFSQLGLEVELLGHELELFGEGAAAIDGQQAG